MKKKIIFIGGVVRSGTSMLNIILSNIPDSIALGEVHGLFYPVKIEHLKKISEIKNTEQDMWKEIVKKGPQELINSLNNYYSPFKVFIDSSKDLTWISEQNQLYKNKGFEIINILIYKSIDNLALSFSKRGILDRMERTYVNYHKRYFGLALNPIIVSYERFISDELYRNNFFEIIGIEKINLDKPININGPNFFGSNTVKSEIYNKKIIIDIQNQPVNNSFDYSRIYKRAYNMQKRLDAAMLKKNTQFRILGSNRFLTKLEMFWEKLKRYYRMRQLRNSNA